MRLSLKSHDLPGRLIAVCGADGSGKTTAISKLESILKSKSGDESSVLLLRQPSNWWRSDPHVRSTVMLQGDAENFDEFALGIYAFADRLNQQVKVIQPALAEGRTVLVDRCVHCLIAYYMARKEPYLDHLVSMCSLLFEPDHTFLLNCSSQVSIDRVVKRDGSNPNRSDQNLSFTTAFIESYRILARYNKVHTLSSHISPDSIIEGIMSYL